MKNTLYGGREAARLLEGAKELYMLGIGGVGMSALALIAKEEGFIVRGEDRADSPTVRKLRERGIEVSNTYHGLGAGADALIYSAAISASHSAFREAEKRGIPILSRSDFLGALMEPYPTRVTVAGIHGKSTVTAMTDHILVRAGLSPTTVSGATLCDGETYRIGKGEIFLAEACEYTDSFLSLSPTIAVALNLEHDHPDYFKDESAIFTSFKKYLEKATKGVVLPTFGPLASLTPRNLQIHTFGDNGELSGKITRECDGEIAFSLFENHVAKGTVKLPLIGKHQVENALAAILTARVLGVPFEVSVEALSDFVSPDRRCKLRLLRGGVRYIDDYAHHPSEIKATLSALRPTCTGRLVCAFEAHTYSRLAAFFEGYLESLTMADLVVVLPIYPARETDTLGQSEKRLSDALSVPSVPCKDLESAARYLKENTAAGDTVAVLGAGNTQVLFKLLSD